MPKIKRITNQAQTNNKFNTENCRLYRWCGRDIWPGKDKGISIVDVEFLNNLPPSCNGWLHGKWHCTSARRRVARTQNQRALLQEQSQTRNPTSKRSTKIATTKPNLCKNNCGRRAKTKQSRLCWICMRTNTKFFTNWTK